MKRFVFAVAVIAAAGAAADTARRRAAVPPPPTFATVAPLFQQHCTACHRPGGSAPFSLMSYKDARPEIQQIKLMVSTREMPPWKPAEGCGEFADVRRLSQDAIDVIRAWVNAGAPEGDPRDLPPPQQFSDSWTLGQPDLVLNTGFHYSPPAGGDSIRHFVLPESFPRDRFLRAIEVRPGAGEIVHHVAVMFDRTGNSAALDAADPLPGFDAFASMEIDYGILGAWVPGARPYQFPQGVALRVPAGATLVLQIHYHPQSPAVPPDQTEIGLYYQRDLIDKIADAGNVFVSWGELKIPAGVKDIAFSRSMVVPEDKDMYAIAGHMHYLGRRIDARAVLPDGTTKCLISIPDWDLHWQGYYAYREPVHLPAGTRIEVTGHYDNSADNPQNPSSPPRDVHGGNNATDEMCGIEFSWAPSAQHLGVPP
jgi:mono/diheme cytochrome c family protein